MLRRQQKLSQLELLHGLKKMLLLKHTLMRLKKKEKLMRNTTTMRSGKELRLLIKPIKQVMKK